MRTSIQRIADDFLNIRGSFKIGGLIDIGTHASLVRRANGRFVFLDSYTLSDTVEREVDALTNSGEYVEAILNLHPFHTVHVRAMHERYPRAKLFTKFQNFFLTTIAVVAYMALAFSVLGASTGAPEGLPGFSKDLLWYIGISHTAYVGGKIPEKS